MNSRALAFLAAGALLLGGVVLVAFWRRREPRPEPFRSGPAETRARRYGEAQQALRLAVERRDRLRRQVADLQKAGADLEGKLPRAPIPAADSPGKEEGFPPLGKAFLDFGRFIVSERVRELKPRLHLTDNQEERLRDLFLKEMDDLVGSGDLGAGNQKAAELRIRAAATGILDGRQMAEFEKFEAEEKARQALEQRQAVLETLSATLDLKPEQARSLDLILEADPGLATNGTLFESISPEELEGSVERLEQTQRRLAAALQPQLTGEQVARLETHFKDSLDLQRELLRYYKLFTAEGADSGR